MNWKKVIICIVIIVLVFGVYAIYDNYRFGKELFLSNNQLLLTCDTLSGSIQGMQEEFQKTDVDPLNVSRDFFDTVLSEARMRFLYEDACLSYDVRLQYIVKIQEIQHEIGSDRRNTCLARFFFDDEKMEDLTAFKKQLEFMYEVLSDFGEQYNAMPKWKRYFVSWKGEREALTEKLRIPE